MQLVDLSVGGARCRVFPDGFPYGGQEAFLAEAFVVLFRLPNGVDPEAVIDRARCAGEDSLRWVLSEFLVYGVVALPPSSPGFA